MSERILLCPAHMSGREMEFIKEAFDTNWVVPMGPNVTGFEHDLEAFVNRREGNEPLDKKVVCLSAGTAAVHLALIACGVGQGDEVLVQSFTFCASSHPITYLGATPVFIDSEKESWNMDPELLEEAIKDRIAKTGKKPKAIIPVALYGMPYQIDKIMEIANRYEIPVIEDGAEGFGSNFNGRALGTFGEYGVLSFNGNKMITTSGGGALICPRCRQGPEILWYATRARESYPYYQHEAIGYNYRMSNICAGIGRGQMTIVDEHVAHHRHVQALYEELLKDVEGITMHTNPGPEYDSNFRLCTATLDPNLKIKNRRMPTSKSSPALLAALQVLHMQPRLLLPTASPTTTSRPCAWPSTQPVLNRAPYGNLCTSSRSIKRPRLHQRRKRGPLRHRHLPPCRPLGDRRPSPLHRRPNQSSYSLNISI